MTNFENIKNFGFDVAEIKLASNKPNYIVATIELPDFTKVEITRRYYRDNALKNHFVFKGVRVTFDIFDHHVVNMEREYETKGVIKTSSVLGSKGSKKISEMVKDEVEDKGIVAKLLDKDEFVDDDEIIKHEQYETIKSCLACNIPVYLAGPAGSGKNFTVEQIAEGMGWEFYFSNSVQQEYKLTGFIDAGGDFHDTEFYKACTSENECVFFLDEMDASIPEVLVLLNAAIANGYFEFPTGRVDFDNVHFVAAGNTVGSGADEMYTGRMVLDQATLDRFAIIEFDYSRKVEMSITKNNVQLVDFIHALREDAELKGIRATFSYRCMAMITKLEADGMDIKVALKITVLKGMDKDTVNTLYANVPGDKYVNALKEIKKAA